MFVECTKYCVAVYHDEQTGNVYDKPVIAWGSDGLSPWPIAFVYDEHIGLEPADADENFLTLNFDPEYDPEELLAEMSTVTEVTDADLAESEPN